MLWVVIGSMSPMRETNAPACAKCGDPITGSLVIAYETVPVDTMSAEASRLLGNRLTFHAQCYPSHQGYAVVRPGSNRCGVLNDDQVCVHVPHPEGTPHLFERASLTPVEGPLEVR